jgi:1-acyl-sn-glycerol-3-phosphate acyltransferase
MIRTLFMALCLSLALLLVMPWLILWSGLSGSADLMYRYAMGALRLADRLVGMRVRAEGLQNIPSGVCIFVANHASNVDALALVPAIPRRVGLLAKKEVFRIPVLSAAMRLAKFVPVDRSDREAAAVSVDIAVERLKEGLSFLVFAEGTRSPDGRLRPFKKGTFLMAIRAGVPIVPTSLIGTQNLMRKGDWSLYPGEVIVRFGPAIESSEYTLERRADLLARVEAAVAEGLPPEQQPLPG